MPHVQEPEGLFLHLIDKTTDTWPGPLQATCHLRIRGVFLAAWGLGLSVSLLSLPPSLLPSPSLLSLKSSFNGSPVWLQISDL